jgi:transposase
MATQMRELAEARKASDWLRAGSSVVQQGALRDLDRAFQNFFAGRSGYPTWRKLSDPKQSFVVRDLTIKRLSKKWGAVLIPKVGFVKFRLTRDWRAIEAATSARVTRHNDVWHVAFTTPPAAKLNPNTGEMVGIDRGVANSIATSDGEFHQAPSLSDGEQARFVALQRRLSRQKNKDSKRRDATKAKLSRLRTKLNNRRTDWVEQTTTALARRYDLVVVEDLRIRNMVTRPAPKPDPDQPGAFLPNGARAKAGLNRAIHASQWGKVEQRLADKTNVGKVNPRNTSRECSNPECRHISENNRKSQAEFICEKCGHTAHADINAARVILERYLNQPQPEDISGARACKPRKSRANHLAAA